MDPFNPYSASDDIMIFSLRKLTSRKYKESIPTGIFLIPKDFCKKNITLKENNKTNSLIDKNDLMLMMRYSYTKKLFMSMDIPSTSRWKWDIMNGFTET
jgi:hypothetical protein